MHAAPPVYYLVPDGLLLRFVIFHMAPLAPFHLSSPDCYKGIMGLSPEPKLLSLSSQFVFVVDGRAVPH
jgi:hypothetical protein